MRPGVGAAILTAVSTRDDRTRPLDEDAVAAVVGDARVVGIGEQNHFIAEFGAVRERLVRFLVDELGFSVLAMESGFVEGHLVDAWLRGERDGFPAAEGFTFRFGDAPETRSLLTGLRGSGLRFSGIDVPGSGGDPAAALRYVRDRLGDAVGVLVDRAEEATRAYAAPNSGLAIERYGQVDPTARDTATSALARLLLRLDAVGAAPDVRHAAHGAVRLDEQLREFDAIMRDADPDVPRTVSSRDVHMADTVRLLLDRHGPDARVVVLAHNGHLQRRPLPIMPGAALDTAGMRLSAGLGGDYRVVGLTARAGTTTAPALDRALRHGIGVATAPLPAPRPGSVEALVDAGSDGVVVDLRGLADGPTSLAGPAGPYDVDVAAAFDAMVVLPTSTPSVL